MASDGSRIVRSLFLRMFLAAVVAGGAAVLITLRIPDSFTARTLLIRAPMPFKSEDPPLTAIDFYAEDPTPRPDWLRVQYVESLPMPDYELILTSDELVARVRDFMEERYAEKGVPVELTVERMRRAMTVNTKIYKQTYQELEYQHVVEMRLGGADPEVVAQAANFWAEESIRLANEMRFAAREGALEYFDAQVAEAEGLLAAQREAVAAIRRESRPDVLERGIRAYERALTRLEIEGQRLQGKIDVVEGDPTVPHTPPLDELRTQLAVVRGQAAALRPALETLQATLADTERRLAEHEHRVRYYETQLEELAMVHYGIRMQSGDITPEFKFVSRALTPQEKTGPWRSLIVVVAVFLAVMAVPVHFFTMHALRRYARQLDEGT